MIPEMIRRHDSPSRIETRDGQQCHIVDRKDAKNSARIKDPEVSFSLSGVIQDSTDQIS